MIKISALSYNDIILPEPLTAVFGLGGGTIGRSEDNSFVLPDSKHVVSRKQAEIKSDGVQHVITNLSRATPLVINDREVAFGEECALNAGDEIRIGLYVLRAESYSNTEQPANAVDHELDKTQVPSHAGITSESGQEEAEDGEVAVAAVAAPLAAKSEQSKPDTAKAEAVTVKPVLSEMPASGDHTALMQAFLQGAGLGNASVHLNLTPEFMEMVGKLAATAVGGTFELLAGRSTVKREVNADMTMVVMRNNNPLKFLPDGQTVLTQFLRKKMPGFMGPVESMEDAYADLRAHQIGVIAGMHAAVDELLKCFNPESLEKRLKDPTIFDNLLPERRKAKLWDQYTAVFGDIYGDAQKDFQTLFGKAFLAAYEKEIERFHRQ